ncbi:hypothetical protein DCCM_3853 [Desulfocucumis palustris]|uniref:Uncharacterized protein n=1 Tax=Desulfocucumis palustris TaxID=1898651 RepID=A0A2L2XG86_9FIRM|nr:hypothetical protein DCCM_3853 [Desulfocucumis palustris]
MHAKKPFFHHGKKGFNNLGHSFAKLLKSVEYINPGRRVPLL